MLGAVADRPEENGGPERRARPAQPADDLAADVERARTPRTPLLALTGVWLAIAVAFVLVLAIVLFTLYFA